jgi:hypothetical protein
MYNIADYLWQLFPLGNASGTPRATGTLLRGLAGHLVEVPVCRPTAPVQAMVSLVLRVNAAHNMGGVEPQAITVVPAANPGSDSVRKE